MRIEADDTIGRWSLGLAFMQGWYTIHQYNGNRIGFVAHTDSTKTVPSCTTVEACKFTTETNEEEEITDGTTIIKEVSDVPEWMLITIAFSALTILGLMLLAYLCCPNKAGKKTTVVLDHHETKK